MSEIQIVLSLYHVNVCAIAKLYIYRHKQYVSLVT